MPILTITIILSILIISMIIIKYENITLKQTNAILIKNNEFYTKLLDNYRILKHNLISQLIGIKSVSNKNTKKLIDDLIKQYNETYNTTQYIKEMPSKVSGIIYEKLYNFKQKDIKLTVDNKIKNDLFNLISPRSYNLLCEALGVLFDNAMEATSETKEKIIYLKFEEKEEEIKITIINTFVGKIDIEKIGSKNYTHKENGHGLGLYSLMGRNKLQIKYHIKNNLFFSEIFIEKRI